MKRKEILKSFVSFVVFKIMILSSLAPQLIVDFGTIGKFTSLSNSVTSTIGAMFIVGNSGESLRLSHEKKNEGK